MLWGKKNQMKGTAEADNHPILSMLICLDVKKNEKGLMSRQDEYVYMEGLQPCGEQRGTTGRVPLPVQTPAQIHCFEL